MHAVHAALVGLEAPAAASCVEGSVFYSHSVKVSTAASVTPGTARQLRRDRGQAIAHCDDRNDARGGAVSLML